MACLRLLPNQTKRRRDFILIFEFKKVKSYFIYLFRKQKKNQS
jgi:hypothetical protein